MPNSCEAGNCELALLCCFLIFLLLLLLASAGATQKEETTTILCRFFSSCASHFFLLLLLLILFLFCWTSLRSAEIINLFQGGNTPKVIFFSSLSSSRVEWKHKVTSSSKMCNCKHHKRVEAKEKLLYCFFSSLQLKKVENIFWERERELSPLTGTLPQLKRSTPYIFFQQS